MKTIFFVIGGLIIGTISATTVSSGGKSTRLNFMISNQSLEHKNARLVIELDGKRVFMETMPVQSQHFYKQFSYDVSFGPHTLALEETQIPVNHRAVIDVDKESWVHIKFAHNKLTNHHHFIVEIDDKPIFIK